MNDMSAFPIPESYEFVPEKGMTLRDYFAAKAMQAIIANSLSYYRTNVAEWAYEQADAMLLERNKR
jgi:hypothetical protein